MFKTLFCVLFRYPCKWKTIETLRLSEIDENGRKFYCGKVYTQECESCGCIKQVTKKY